MATTSVTQHLQPHWGFNGYMKLAHPAAAAWMAHASGVAMAPMLL